MSVTGLLYSQIGYDIGHIKRVIVRGPAGTLPEYRAQYQIRSYRGKIKHECDMVYWGELWGSHWWIGDFSMLQEPGSYFFVPGVHLPGNRLKIGENLLWEKTWYLAAIDQGERRARLAREKLGWYDAGTAWQEANSHAAYVAGQCDVLEFAAHKLTADERAKLEAQIRNGCDYLAALQEKAALLPGGEGAVVHQIWKYDELILPADVSKAAMAWARAGRFLTDEAKRTEYLDRAAKAMRWLETAEPLGAKGFSAINHGVPADFIAPPEWMTRDLVMACWAAWELAEAGQEEFRAESFALAEKILTRQVSREKAEGGFFGHFRTFASARFTEKAWVHHGDGGYGADCGGTFPHYLIPLLRMAQKELESPFGLRVRQTLHDFAYGYFLPACQANPFLLLPQGYVEGKGLIWFAGIWHGMNAAYGLAAALALEFADFFDDVAFRDIATGNLQWIAGLNAGLTAESLSASHMYSVDIPAGEAIPVSMICGVGERTAGSWMQIRGSICNGFSTGDQFRFDVEAKQANDGPHTFTDEDWITHAGGWLSAISRLQKA